MLQGAACVFRFKSFVYLKRRLNRASKENEYFKFLLINVDFKPGKLA